jgi:hypothetical protein
MEHAAAALIGLRGGSPGINTGRLVADFAIARLCLKQPEPRQIVAVPAIGMLLDGYGIVLQHRQSVRRARCAGVRLW